MNTHNSCRFLRTALIPALAAIMLSFSSCGSSRSYWGVDGTTPDGNIHYTVGSESHGHGYHGAPPHHSKKEIKRWKKEQKKRMKERKKAEKRYKKAHRPHRPHK